MAHGKVEKICEPAARRPRVVIVDDEELVGQALNRALSRAGFASEHFLNGSRAVEHILDEEVDVVVSDIAMPECSGIELLREVRRKSLDLPVILVTGSPSLTTAIEAIEHGAFRYLLKPFSPNDLISAVQSAVATHDLAKLRRRMAALHGNGSLAVGDLAGLDVRFDAALEQLYVVHQPIVCVQDETVYGYEALVRSHEASLSTPRGLLDAAERLDRLHKLSRSIRRLNEQALNGLPTTARLFVNLHPDDLLDESLYDSGSELSRNAMRVVLEITERAPLEKVAGVRERIRRLRDLGFSIAIDDVGAGYAGLTSFTLLEPDVVKLDMALVRNIHRTPAAETLVHSLLTACQHLGVLVVAEGVETIEERDALAAIGCQLMQGHVFARPGAGFPRPSFVDALLKPV